MISIFEGFWLWFWSLSCLERCGRPVGFISTNFRLYTSSRDLAKRCFYRFLILFDLVFPTFSTLVEGICNFRRQNRILREKLYILATGHFYRSKFWKITEYSKKSIENTRGNPVFSEKKNCFLNSFRCFQHLENVEICNFLKFQGFLKNNSCAWQLELQCQLFFWKSRLNNIDWADI